MTYISGHDQASSGCCTGGATVRWDACAEFVQNNGGDGARAL